MPFNDWQDPKTWHAGEPINADSWEDRVHDPLSLLLRRPLTIARRTTNKTIATGGTPVIMDWDVVDNDDDGMVTDDIAAANVTTFYAQRDGVYAVYFAATCESTTDNAVRTNAVYIYINGTQQCRKEAAVTGSGTTQDNWRALNANINLSEGDALSFYVANKNNTFTFIVNAQFNAPRCVMMWLRPLGS